MLNEIKRVKPIYKAHEDQNTLIRPIRKVYEQEAKETNPPTTNQKNMLQKKSFTPYGFATYLTQTRHFLWIRSVLHVYNDQFGYYQPLTTGHGDFYIRSITPAEFCGYLSINIIKEIICWLETLVKEHASPEELYYSSLCLNFTDGYLDIMSLSLYQHHPKKIFTSFIPFSYAECRASKGSPLFDSWLKNITEDNQDLIVLLSQIFGYIMSEYRNAKHIFIFYGPSGSGKSIWLDLITNAIGEQFTKSISIHSLTDKFRTAELVGAKANICAEIDRRKITNIDIIKSLVGGRDKINADVKNEKPIEFYNAAALVFSSNTLEFLDAVDPGNALTKRIIAIPFNKVIADEKTDNDISYKLLKELPHIIYKFAIPGFNLFALNRFKFDLGASYQINTNPESIKNVAINFLENTCIFDNSTRIHTDRLYNIYINYCNKTKSTALTKPKFKELLLNLHLYLKNIAPLTYSDKFRDNGENKAGFYGMSLRPS